MDIDIGRSPVHDIALISGIFQNHHHWRRVNVSFPGFLETFNDMRCSLAFELCRRSRDWISGCNSHCWLVLDLYRWLCFHGNHNAAPVRALVAKFGLLLSEQ